MILVTGAAGKTGRAVVGALVGAGQQVRGLVRRPEQAAVLESIGAQETHLGDMQDPASLARAAEGASAIYHICPNVHPAEVAIGQAAIRAAQAAGVELFVYHSVLHPQTEAMPHHWNKLRVEEELLESGLSFCVLQPCAYMQNILGQWESAAERGVYPVPYSVQSPLSMVDLLDVATVAALVLTEPGHAGATYQLCGPAALTSEQVAAALSEHLARPVVPSAMPIAAWRERAQASGLGEYQIETLVKMFRYYDQNGLIGNPRVLEWLLGRPPTTLTEFIARISRQRGNA
jgi:uncharacterized protein YbjT (DUF2867 family)